MSIQKIIAIAVSSLLAVGIAVCGKKIFAKRRVGK